MGTVLPFPVRGEHKLKLELLTSKGFYSRVEAARIARVPVHRLDAWRREKIIRPTLRMHDEDGKVTAGYSFDELIYLRVVRMLRDDRHMPLELAVRSVKHIVARCGTPSPEWANARVFIDNGRVCLISDDDWPATVANMSGQALMEAVFGVEFTEMKARADALLVPRPFDKFVTVNPLVCDGQPCISAERIETSVIYRLSNRVRQLSEIRQSFPALKLNQIKMAVAFEKFLDGGGGLLV